MALVIVLAFVAMLTVVVLAFFSRAMSDRQVSNSSAQRNRADILAKSALDIIVGDLRQEIAAGSTVTVNGEVTIYLPTPTDSGTKYRTMGPAKIAVPVASGTNPALTSMVRRSARTGSAPDWGAPTDGYTNFPANRASPASSGTASLNARFISAARWNAGYLLPKDQAKLGDDSTDPTSDFANSLPDWVYVTRSGATPKTNADVAAMRDPANANYALGRYAFVMYDEGGLLDMNVAGYPADPVASGTKGLSAAQSGPKGSIALANLAALPTTASGTLPQDQVNNIVGWRNYATAQLGSPNGSFKNFTFDAATATNWLNNFVLKNDSGFLKLSGSSVGGLTDQALLSRRELLKLRQSLGFSVNALQYMGTFSRAVTTPTWKPVTPAGSTIDYGGLADDPKSANRNLANLRVTTTASFIHYKDDGTQEAPSTLKTGEPFLQRRFSLAKLAWLGHNGPNAAAFAPSVSAAQQATAIKACFGLTWHPASGGATSSDARWEYSHGKSFGILTLEEVRTASREPDFFELLKAGILNGSLGGQPGLVGGVDTDTTGPAGVAFNQYSPEKDRHILQIGANLIDQADADNYPTAVYQPIVDGQYAVPYGEKALFDTVFGMENLPVLQRLSAVSYARNVTDASGNWQVGTEDVWIQPEVWNPHERSTADPVKYPNTPGHLRLVTYGGCQIKVKETTTSKSGDPPAIGQPPEKPFEWFKDFGSDPLKPDPAGTIAFVNPKPGNTKPNDFFNKPVKLESTGIVTTGATNYFDPVVVSGSNNYLYYANPGAGTDLMGVWLGKFDRDPRDRSVGGYPTHFVDVFPLNNSGEPQITFVLEYNDRPDGTGVWLPYTMMARIQQLRSTSQYTYNHRDGDNGWFLFWGAGRPDPRTDRFSAHSGNGNSSGTTYTYVWSSNNSIRPNAKLNSNQGSAKGCISYLMPDTAQGFVYRNPVNYPGPPKAGRFAVGYMLDDWAWNVPKSDSEAHFWYVDPDGVARPGDAWRADYGPRPANGDEIRNGNNETTCGDGVLLYHYDQLTPSKDRRRPVILNRPFRSVGELGYVFRDQPFKTLDFWSDKSADAGLLDLFAVYDEPVIVAGRVNINNAPAGVLQAIASGTIETSGSSTIVLSGTQASTEGSVAGKAITSDLSTNGPLMNPAELVSRLSNPIYTALSGISSNNTSTDQPIRNKGYGEATLRALSSTVNTRTWNLLIDVVAQAGSFPSGASSTATLNSAFVVQGERRYWFHIAIDRFTGRVIDQQLEAVYE